jgi:carbonic anhydrase
VCGHYGCGGIEAALHNRTFGLIDNWLRHVQDVRNKHAHLLTTCQSDAERMRRLCELNIVEQIVNVCQTTMVQSAWQRKQPLAVHGLIYDVAEGLLSDIGMTVARSDDLARQYEAALARIGYSSG